jgi:hypothetical protein
VAALRILGTGGYIKEPAFLSALLADQVVEVQHVAFWGLVLMEGGKGLAHAQRYPGRAQAIGERLKEVRAGVTDELVAAQTTAFDKAVAAITGKAAVSAKSYVSNLPRPPATTNASADSVAPSPPAVPDAPADNRRHPSVPRAPTLEAADQR